MLPSCLFCHTAISMATDFARLINILFTLITPLSSCMLLFREREREVGLDRARVCKAVRQTVGVIKWMGNFIKLTRPFEETFFLIENFTSLHCFSSILPPIAKPINLYIYKYIYGFFIPSHSPRGCSLDCVGKKWNENVPSHHSPA